MVDMVDMMDMVDMVDKMDMVDMVDMMDMVDMVDMMDMVDKVDMRTWWTRWRWWTGIIPQYLIQKQILCLKCPKFCAVFVINNYFSRVRKLWSHCVEWAIYITIY